MVVKVRRMVFYALESNKCFYEIWVWTRKVLLLSFLWLMEYKLEVFTGRTYLKIDENY